MFFVINIEQLQEYKQYNHCPVVSSNANQTLFIVPAVDGFENYIKQIDTATRNRYILTGNWND